MPGIIQWIRRGIKRKTKRLDFTADELDETMTQIWEDNSCPRFIEVHPKLALNSDCKMRKVIWDDGKYHIRIFTGEKADGTSHEIKRELEKKYKKND